MKVLTTNEKLSLIRHHGDLISRRAQNDFAERTELNASAQRVLELVKSIPKADLE